MISDSICTATQPTTTYRTWAAKIQKTLPTMDWWRIRSLAKRGLHRKLLNYIIANVQFARHDVFLWGYPIHLAIESSIRCTLRCPLCSVGTREQPKPWADMPLETFKGIIDELGPYLLIVDLSNKGEPTMNDNLYEMIAYCKKYNIETRINTNLQIEEGVERLVESGLDFLTASVDGASQESYEKYRVGGKFELALENMRRVMEAKYQLKRETPLVEWKFIVFRHNEHEIEAAKRLAVELGVDRLVFAGAKVGNYSSSTGRDHWLPSNPEFRIYGGEGKISKNTKFRDLEETCNLPWMSLAFDPLGYAGTCCRVERREHDHGTFQKNFYWTVWNGKRFRQSRRYLRHDPSAEPSDKTNLCLECTAGSFHNVHL